MARKKSAGAPAAAAPRAELLSRVLSGLVVALYGVLTASLLVLAWVKPMAGDDYGLAYIIKRHPDLGATVSYYYRNQFGRVLGSAMNYLAFEYRPVATVTQALTLPAIAVLVVALGLGRIPAWRPKDMGLVAFVTVALWFALPIRWDVFWTSGWGMYSLPTLLMLAVVLPYRIWARDPSAARATSAATSARTVAMFALGVAAGQSHESMLAVLVTFALVFGWFVVRGKLTGKVPPWLWAGLAGGAVGGAILVAAPGNAVRAGLVGGTAISLSQRFAALSAYAGSMLGTWFLPLYPWLACILIVTIAVKAAGKRVAPIRDEPTTWPVWLLGALAAVVPFIVFPQVAAERTVMFTAVLMLVAAVSCLVPESVDRLIGRIPFLAGAVVISLLLVVTIYDVSHNIRVSQQLDAALAQRAAIAAQQKSKGLEQLTLPVIGYLPARAVLWGDAGDDAGSLFNQAVADYYGVRSVVVTSAP